jgi:hypothetical protein
MMNARQRRMFAIASHDSGSTTRKKIVKVAVGKSKLVRRALPTLRHRRK